MVDAGPGSSLYGVTSLALRSLLNRLEEDLIKTKNFVWDLIILHQSWLNRKNQFDQIENITFLRVRYNIFYLNLCIRLMYYCS